jgi:hypothetical protein
VYTAVRLAKRRMSEIEYIWTTTNFMLKEIFLMERRVYSVKKEKFPELFVKTIQPARQISVRFNWWVHSTAHSSAVGSLLK